MMLSVCPCLSQRLVSALLPARELAWSSSTCSPWRATSLPFTLAYHAWQHHLTYSTGTSMVMPLLASIIIYIGASDTCTASDTLGIVFYMYMIRFNLQGSPIWI